MPVSDDEAVPVDPRRPEDETVPVDDRPVYRIAVFGLGDRFRYLLEVIVKHARSNNYRYQIAEPDAPGDFDIALVDMTARGGADVARTLKSVPHAFPVIGVGRRSNRRSGNDDLLLATFSLDVLGVLNKAAQSVSSRESARRAGSHPAHPEGGLHLPQVSGRPPRALVVEPSPSVRSELAAALRQIGVDAEGVGALAQAVDVLSMRSYELVILEPQQPDGDGLSVMRRLKHEFKARKRVLPIIVLSSRSGMLDLVKAAWAGCNGYLGKPVTVGSLHATVNRVLLRSLRPRLNAQRKARQAASAEPLPAAGTQVAAAARHPAEPAALPTSALLGAAFSAHRDPAGPTAAEVAAALASLRDGARAAPGNGSLANPPGSEPDASGDLWPAGEPQRVQPAKADLNL